MRLHAGCASPFAACLIAAIAFTAGAGPASSRAKKTSPGSKSGQAVARDTPPKPKSPEELIEPAPRPSVLDEAVRELLGEVREEGAPRTKRLLALRKLGELESDHAIWALADLLTDKDLAVVRAASSALVMRDHEKVQGAVLAALATVGSERWDPIIEPKQRAAWRALRLHRIESPKIWSPAAGSSTIGNYTLTAAKGPEKGAREVHMAAAISTPVRDRAGKRIVVKRIQEAITKYDPHGQLVWAKVIAVTPAGTSITGHSRKPVTIGHASRLAKLASQVERTRRDDFRSAGTLYTAIPAQDQRLLNAGLAMIGRTRNGLSVVKAWKAARAKVQ